MGDFTSLEIWHIRQWRQVQRSVSCVAALAPTATKNIYQPPQSLMLSAVMKNFCTETRYCYSVKRERIHLHYSGSGLCFCVCAGKMWMCRFHSNWCRLLSVHCECPEATWHHSAIRCPVIQPSLSDCQCTGLQVLMQMGKLLHLCWQF